MVSSSQPQSSRPGLVGGPVTSVDTVGVAPKLGALVRIAAISVGMGVGSLVGLSVGSIVGEGVVGSGVVGDDVTGADVVGSGIVGS